MQLRTVKLAKLSRSSVGITGDKTSCTLERIEGTNAGKLTCTFTEDIGQSKHNFNVLRYDLDINDVEPETVFACYWLKTERKGAESSTADQQSTITALVAAVSAIGAIVIIIAIVFAIYMIRKGKCKGGTRSNVEHELTPMRNGDGTSDHGTPCPTETCDSSNGRDFSLIKRKQNSPLGRQFAFVFATDIRKMTVLCSVPTPSPPPASQ
ncbi:hypothetical protein BaRGS_00039502 [Batillaria attramentaria]|uniref:Uncharacterized protein n=1 Tax=Batillaria attramentaria TaxID=370345 RepID=A0ABD0J2T1_9CAEN